MKRIVALVGFMICILALSTVAQATKLVMDGFTVRFEYRAYAYTQLEDESYDWIINTSVNAPETQAWFSELQGYNTAFVDEFYQLRVRVYPDESQGVSMADMYDVQMTYNGKTWAIPRHSSDEYFELLIKNPKLFSIQQLKEYWVPGTKVGFSCGIREIQKTGEFTLPDFGGSAFCEFPVARITEDKLLILYDPENPVLWFDLVISTYDADGLVELQGGEIDLTQAGVDGAAVEVPITADISDPDKKYFLNILTPNAGPETEWRHSAMYELPAVGETAGSPRDNYNGWWYSPSYPGMGVSLDYSNTAQGEIVFLSWYVYDDSGTAKWYVAWTKKQVVDGNTIFAGDISQWTGWPLGQPWNGANGKNVGKVALDFDLTEPSMDFIWHFDKGGSGKLDMYKYMSAMVDGARDFRDITGWWSADGYPAMGLFMEARGDTLFVGWYHFRENKSARWWVNPAWNNIGGFPFGTKSTTLNFIEFENGWSVADPTATPSETTPADPNFMNASLTFTESSNGKRTATLVHAGTTYNLEPYTVRDNSMSDWEKRMSISSAAFEKFGDIPTKYTCFGDDMIPPLSFNDVPDEAQSLALIVDDFDAPDGTWNHWVLFNLPADTTGISEAAADAVSLPSGAVQGTNSWGNTSYGGPCPPSGQHRYRFKLYALSDTLDLDSTATQAEVETALSNKILSYSELMGMVDAR